ESCPIDLPEGTPVARMYQRSGSAAVGARAPGSPSISTMRHASAPGLHRGRRPAGRWPAPVRCGRSGLRTLDGVGTRVLAAMSGGVDSPVAAARAVGAGHDVTRVHLALSPAPARTAPAGGPDAAPPGPRTS